MLFTLPDAAVETTIVSKELHLHNAVIKNVKILAKNEKRGQLHFVEAHYINRQHLKLNSAQRYQRDHSYLINSHINLT